MREELLIRVLRKEDLDAAVKLETENFSLPWKRADFEQALEDPQALFLVAETRGQVVGMCGVKNILGEGEISNVSVSSRHRGRKIAYRMLAELLQNGADLGIRAFTLEVRSGNEAAVNLYKKLGFQTEGIRKRFYQKPVEDALIMWKR